MATTCLEIGTTSSRYIEFITIHAVPLILLLYSAFQPFDFMVYQIAYTTEPAYCVFMGQLLNICVQKNFIKHLFGRHRWSLVS